MMMSELPQVTIDFLDENEKLCQIIPKSKKGGPYSKEQKESRRNEVYRLYFDYGYSARKIAEVMKIHRSTVNGDVDFWYNQVTKNFNEIDPTIAIVEQITKLKDQKTRLREYLDKTESVTEKHTIERLILDVDSKITHIHFKMQDSTFKIHEQATRWVNEFMKKNNETQRYSTIFDTIKVSTKAHERIMKIINEDRGNQKL